jgi:hypothetical protein
MSDSGSIQLEPDFDPVFRAPDAQAGGVQGARPLVHHDEGSVYETGGHRFESCRASHRAPRDDGLALIESRLERLERK